MKHAVFLFIAVGIVALLNADFLRAQLAEEQDPEMLLAELQTVLPNTEKSLIKDTQFLEQELAAQAEFDEKREQARVTCTENLRRANRDNKTETLLQCYRSDLQLEQSWLRQMKPRIQKLIASDTRTLMHTTTSDLLEAIVTIIDGIDTGVFTEEADILESKGRLLDRYRIPFWNARVSLLRERLQWQLRDAVDAIAVLDDATKKALTSGLVCVRDTATMLSSQTIDREELQEAATKTRDCLAMLESAMQESGSGTTTVE